MTHIKGSSFAKPASRTDPYCSVSPKSLSQNHLDAQKTFRRPIISAHGSTDSSSIPVPARITAY